MTKAPLSRRELLRVLGTSALAALPASAFPVGASQLARPWGQAGPLRVGLVPCPDYRPENLLEAVRTGWRDGRPPDVRGKRVVIKPNIADFSPARPIPADPRLVEALVLHLQAQGAREIVLAEGPAHNRDTELLFRQAGYESLARRYALPLVDLNEDDARPVKNANPRARLREFHVPETILSAEVLVSVAKMKTHRLAGVTLSLKNMFGILPGMIYGWPKNVLHWNGIPQSICDINGTVRSHFSIIDGVIGMEGYGPLLGPARKAGVLVMGANALATDAAAARVMGIDPQRVDYLVLAQMSGLGSLRRQDIAVAGPKIDDLRTDFSLEPEFVHLRASSPGTDSKAKKKGRPKPPLTGAK
jgi:uncharacterized protein (DUF362 family)